MNVTGAIMPLARQKATLCYTKDYDNYHPQRVKDLL